MRYDVLEDFTTCLLRDYMAKGGKMKPPIDVDKIAECLCDLNVDWRDMAQITDDPRIARALRLHNVRAEMVLGGLIPRQKLVLINTRHKEDFDRWPGRYRFTVAHEVGHWVMHVDKSALDHPRLFDPADPTMYDGGIICRSNDRSNREWQANMFAAMLLMPRGLVIEAVSGIRRPIPVNYCYKLASIFNVSLSAMMIRLRQMGVETHRQTAQLKFV